MTLEIFKTAASASHTTCQLSIDDQTQGECSSGTQSASFVGSSAFTQSPTDEIQSATVPDIFSGDSGDEVGEEDCALMMPPRRRL